MTFVCYVIESKEIFTTREENSIRKHVGENVDFNSTEMFGKYTISFTNDRDRVSKSLLKRNNRDASFETIFLHMNNICCSLAIKRIYIYMRQRKKNNKNTRISKMIKNQSVIERCHSITSEINYDRRRRKRELIDFEFFFAQCKSVYVLC